MLSSTDPGQLGANTDSQRAAPSTARLQNPVFQQSHVLKNAAVVSDRAKRRIRPSPAPAWGADQGNISMLSSTETLPASGVNNDLNKVRSPESSEINSASDMKGVPRPPSMETVIDVMDSEQAGTGNMQGIDCKKERLNLARLYSALICCHLVPSTALELHLLVRLLTAKDDAAVSMNLNERGVVFRAVLASANCCQSFAVEVLTRVMCILRNLDSDIISSFITCPPFAMLLPNETKELTAVVERRRESSLTSDVDAVSIAGRTNQTPLLTLPFDHDRDSRHNYRTREEMAIYKNREESRDAFLYQLRAFQNIRGKVLDEVQAERSIDRIRTASRNVIEGILKSNMFWFAQLFCDLLAQIGLVPMEETDKELLNITDKDKLQVRSYRQIDGPTVLYM